MSDQFGDAAHPLLTLTRAARLVGVTRAALQKKIKNGELPTFEGMVQPTDLLRVYPETRLEDNTVMEQITRIKDDAFAARVREHVLPTPEVLAERLTGLGKELAEMRGLVERYKNVIEWLYNKFGEHEKSDNGELKSAMATLQLWLRHELEKGSLKTDYMQSLAVKESFLRLMTAHVHLLPSQHEFFVEGSDTILDAALRAGLPLRYGCSNGQCGLCLATIVSGKTLPVRHHDFVPGEAKKNPGQVLLCMHTAVSDLVIEAQEIGSLQDIPPQQIAARVKNLEPLDASTMRLQLQTPQAKRLQFLAGQQVTLEVGNGIEANHPVASCPCEDRHLQFHIRKISGNRFSDYVFRKLKIDDIVSIAGPKGEFVLNDVSPRSLIFIAHGNGFAPIKSLIEHAMALDAAENMHLYWIAQENGHYLHNLCRAWADALDNFHYTPLVDDTNESIQALHRVEEDHPELTGFDVYAAGPEAFVAAAKNLLRVRGLPPTHFIACQVN